MLAQTAQIEAQSARIEELTQRVAELEAKLGQPTKTPVNSSLPPSQARKPSRAERRAAKQRKGRPGVSRALAPSPAASFPMIPEVTFPTVYNTYQLLNFGPLFNSLGGILTLQPPLNGPNYVIVLPKTDNDGIQLAGVHQIESRAPLGTSTGWNIRTPDHRGPNLCSLTGSYFPFAITQADRSASGDPRPSLQELYGDHAGFVNAVTTAADQLVHERFLLDVDADADISAAEASNVLQ